MDSVQNLASAAVGSKPLLDEIVNARKINGFLDIMNRFLTDIETYLETKVNPEIIAKIIDYSISNDFSSDFCPFERYSNGKSPQELLNIVRTQEASYEEYWNTAKMLQNYIKDSKISVVNKQIEKFWVTNFFVQIAQAGILYQNYEIIQTAGETIEDETIFDDILKQIDKIKSNLDNLENANKIKNSDKSKLDRLIRKATEQLNKKDKSLVVMDADLTRVKESSKINGFTNCVNVIVSTISLGSKFQIASTMNKVFSLVFGPVGYGLLAAGNAKQFFDANQNLKDLRKKQKELDMVKEEIDELWCRMDEIMENIPN